jgi:hypothetical protein
MIDTPRNTKCRAPIQVDEKPPRQTPPVEMLNIGGATKHHV